MSGRHGSHLVLLLGKTLDFRLRFGDAGFVGDACAVLDSYAPGADVDSNRRRGSPSSRARGRRGWPDLGPGVASELTAMRYDRVVEAMGGYGERVTSLAEIGPAIEWAIASGKPACIEVPVSRDPSPLTNAVIARGGAV